MRIAIGRLLINSFYTNDEEIKCDCSLMGDNGDTYCGKAYLVDYSERLRFVASLKDCKLQGFKNKESNEMVYVFNSTDLPPYYTAELTNFQTKDRKEEHLSKKITVKINKAQMSNDLKLNMCDDCSEMTGAITPLVVDGKLADIILED
jgi:hypothetical protein